MAPLPWIPDAIRERLLADVVFAGLLEPDRVVFDQPPDVTVPFATIQVPGNIPISGDGVAYSPLVQVDGWCPTSDPAAARIAWDIASAAGLVLGRSRNISYGSINYSARITDGPMSGPLDVSRGSASPLKRALIRAELRVHSL